MKHPYTNQLINQTSPYLLQHAHNPVNWYAWGEEALQKAQQENKPILVSIGYAACHWCHVMERESFENVATAEIMNQHFINIKIDREERPDLDAIYMEAVQMISGSGGWPLNVFLTPEAKPFYGGTYFPPIRAFNRSSWTEVLQSINQAWQEKPTEIIAQAENLTEHIRTGNIFGQNKNSNTDFTNEHLSTIESNLLKIGDSEWGGFGKAPKFPQTFSIQFLLRQSYFNQKSKEPNSEDPSLKQALLSLDKMIYGGIYDQLAGGFARYSTDREWLAPHFEKMLYDNALLISVMSEAYQLTRLPLYKETIEQTLDFIQQYWQSPLGGFYSAYDADSEGVEGKYYVWTKKEIDLLLGVDAPLFCSYYNVTEAGNWEDTNILWVAQPLETFCSQLKLDELKTKEILHISRSKLLAARDIRIKPLLDDKILMGWNALMITACCKAYAALLEPRFLEMAEKAQLFIENHLKDENGKWFHNYKASATNPAFLDDMAFYIQALIQLAEVTGNNDYFQKAKVCTLRVINDFQDTDSPFFFYTPVWQTDVIVRKKEFYDGATPSGNSVMAWNLNYLSIIFDEPSWKSQCLEMIQTVQNTTLQYPNSFANWGCMLQQIEKGTYEIVISGKEGLNCLHQMLPTFLPNKILQSQLSEASGFPLLNNRWQAEKTLLYLCENYNCKIPVETVSGLLQMISI